MWPRRSAAGHRRARPKVRRRARRRPAVVEIEQREVAVVAASPGRPPRPTPRPVRRIRARPSRRGLRRSTEPPRGGDPGRACCGRPSGPARPRGPRARSGGSARGWSTRTRRCRRPRRSRDGRSRGRLFVSTPPVGPSSKPDFRASITSGIAPHPADDRVGRERETGARHDALDPVAVPLEAVDLLAADHLYTVGLEDPLEVAAGPGAEVALERRGLLHHDRAPLAERGQRGGDLDTEIGTPDDHHPVGVLPCRVGARRRWPAPGGSGSRRARSRRPRDGGPSRRWRSGRSRTRRSACSRVWPSGLRRRSLGRWSSSTARCRCPPTSRLVDQGLVAGLQAPEVALGDRRPVVGRVELPTDQDDRPSAPSSRRVRAAVAQAMPPPIRRCSTRRSAAIVQTLRDSAVRRGRGSLGPGRRSAGGGSVAASNCRRRASTARGFGRPVGRPADRSVGRPVGRPADRSVGRSVRD